MNRRAGVQGKLSNKPSGIPFARVMMVNFNGASSAEASPATSLGARRLPPRPRRVTELRNQPRYWNTTASTQSLAINLVITCENRRKEIANLSS
ncbi:unnamed protein product, partial [Iphiclides podalirius]